MKFKTFFFLSLILLQSFPSNSQSFLGVNYGQVADNLPPPDATAKLLLSTSFSKLRLYGADPAIIKSLSNTNTQIVIGAANGDIPNLAASPSFASQWIASNVLPFVPASKISLISIGNEVLESNDPGLSAQLLPAMQNVQNALAAANLNSVKVSTVNTMAVLGASEPPSSGAFRVELLPSIKGILDFLQKTGSQFMINPYPYFAYRDDPRPETLSFCLFEANPGRFDANTKINYMNMWDAQLDAVKSALMRAGFADSGFLVAETGWPSRGDPNENGATVDNAKAFNGNLIRHLRSMVGTPLMPGKSVETYIFALYDEDLKPGPESERSFGLFHADMSLAYDVGLSETDSASNSSRQVSPPSSTPAKKPTDGWCVPKADATDAELQSALDYACSQQGVDCSAIQPGGSCYEPATVRSHAAYAMNQLYQDMGRNSWNCDFSQTAALTSNNPSYDTCVYTGG